jgi:hypothetical protein
MANPRLKPRVILFCRDAILRVFFFGKATSIAKVGPSKIMIKAPGEILGLFAFCRDAILRV